MLNPSRKGSEKNPRPVSIPINLSSKKVTTAAPESKKSQRAPELFCTSSKIKDFDLGAPYKIEWKNSSSAVRDQKLKSKEPLKISNLANNCQHSATTGSQPPSKARRAGEQQFTFSRHEAHHDFNFRPSSNSKVFYQSMKSELMNIKQDVQKMMGGKPKVTKPLDLEPHSPDARSRQLSARSVDIKERCQKNQSSHEEKCPLESSGESRIEECQFGEGTIRKDSQNASSFRNQYGPSKQPLEVAIELDTFQVQRKKTMVGHSLTSQSHGQTDQTNKIRQKLFQQLKTAEKKLQEKERECFCKDQTVRNLQKQIGLIRKHKQTQIEEISIRYRELQERNKGLETRLKQSLNFQETERLKEICQETRVKLETQVENSRKNRKKMKNKQNQLYIYQEELKSAKEKIRSLKSTISEMERTQAKSNDHSDARKLESESSLGSQTPDCKQSQELIVCQQKIKGLSQLVSDINGKLEAKEKSLSEMTQKYQKALKLIQVGQACREKSLGSSSPEDVMIFLRNCDMGNVAEEISAKMSELVSKTYELQNSVNQKEAKAELLEIENNSLRAELKMHEEHYEEYKQKGGRVLRIEDWDNLAEERDRLKQKENEAESRLREMLQFFEVEQMKKDNIISELEDKLKAAKTSFPHGESVHNDSDLLQVGKLLKQSLGLEHVQSSVKGLNDLFKLCHGLLQQRLLQQRPPMSGLPQPQEVL